MILFYSHSHENAELRMRAGSQGYDMKITEIKKELFPGTYMLGTGIKMEFPKGYYAHIYARSSLVKSGFIVTNSVGIIDNDYRGEIMAVMTKINPESKIEDLVGQFAIQLIPMQYIDDIAFARSKTLSETLRGANGFGSTQ
jgi:dUTP pyrophosphatase